MTTNNSNNNQFDNASDGFDLSGGTTKRKLTVTGADVTLTGSGSNVYTMPSSTDTLVGRASTDTLTNKTLTSPVISAITNTGTLTLPTSTDTLVGRATTDTLTNKTIDGGSNTLSNIPFSALLSTIFGGQVQSYTNTGTAGGTGYYVNLGGVKICWGFTNSKASTTSPTNYVINFPSSFFTTLTACTTSIFSVGAYANQVLSGSGGSTSAVSYYITAPGTGGGAATISWIAIGT
jgi:hypothetical protein